MINFNKSTELLFVQLRLFDDWKEEFRSWANKSRSLAIGCRICGNEQSCENIKRRNIIKIVKIVINKKTEENLENNLIEYLEKIYIIK